MFNPLRKNVQSLEEKCSVSAKLPLFLRTTNVECNFSKCKIGLSENLYVFSRAAAYLKAAKQIKISATDA
jgi:hypothetical protein